MNPAKTASTAAWSGNMVQKQKIDQRAVVTHNRKRVNLGKLCPGIYLTKGMVRTRGCMLACPGIYLTKGMVRTRGCMLACPRIYLT